MTLCNISIDTLTLNAYNNNVRKVLLMNHAITRFFIISTINNIPMIAGEYRDKESAVKQMEYLKEHFMRENQTYRVREWTVIVSDSEMKD